MDSVENLLLDYLDGVMNNKGNVDLNLQELPNQFQEFGNEFKIFCDYVLEVMDLAGALAKGDLDITLPSSSNKLAAPLKSLHATLKHLTWQTQRVAQRDYKQRVDFMGDFSEAFNTMTEQLEKQHAALLREIENRQRQIYALAQNKSLYELLVGQIEQWIVVTDARTAEWLFVSHGVENTLEDQVEANQLRRWMIRQMEEMNDQEGMRTAELELTSEDCVKYYSVTIHPLYWYDRNAFAFVLTDVSKEREQLHTLQNIANYDTLTQVYSRRYGMDIIEQWLAEEKQFILSFVDIDNLKYVNDRFGHNEGDQYIMLVANILRKFSSDAIVCRLGGDEFMLVVEGWEEEAASKRLEDMRERLAEYDHGDAFAYQHSMSYGVVGVEAGKSSDVSNLLSMADEKMYEYKRTYKKSRKRSS